MYNISEAAKETGLSKHTLRYYEKIELLAITKDEKGLFHLWLWQAIQSFHNNAMYVLIILSLLLLLKCCT